MNTSPLPQTRGARINLWAGLPLAGGLAFGLGNLLFVVNKLDEMSRLFLGRWMPDVISGEQPALIAAGQAALIFGYVVFYQVYAPRAGRPGRAALRLLTGGGIGLAVSHIGFMSALAPYLPAAVRPYVEYFFPLVIVGLLGLLAGLLWFGALNLRQPVFSRWPWLPLATGGLGFIGFFVFSGENITAIFLVFRTLFAFGLIGLGVGLSVEKPVQPGQGDPAGGAETPRD